MVKLDACPCDKIQLLYRNIPDFLIIISHSGNMNALLFFYMTFTESNRVDAHS